MQYRKSKRRNHHTTHFWNENVKSCNQKSKNYLRQKKNNSCACKRNKLTHAQQKFLFLSQLLFQITWNTLNPNDAVSSFLNDDLKPTGHELLLLLPLLFRVSPELWLLQNWIFLFFSVGGNTPSLVSAFHHHLCTLKLPLDCPLFVCPCFIYVARQHSFHEKRLNGDTKLLLPKSIDAASFSPNTLHLPTHWWKGNNSKFYDSVGGGGASAPVFWESIEARAPLRCFSSYRKTRKRTKKTLSCPSILARARYPPFLFQNVASIKLFLNAKKTPTAVIIFFSSSSSSFPSILSCCFPWCHFFPFCLQPAEN